jgi:tetratricopeptide (TPR) repeat protein
MSYDAPILRPFIAPLLLWWGLAACATSGPVPGARVETAPAGVAPARAAFEDAALGYRFSLPDSSFQPTDEGGWVVASGDLGVRVFPVFTAGPADPSACRQRIVEEELLPADVNRPLTSADELASLAVDGWPHGGRRLFLQVYPREEGCLVAVVDGREGARTTTAAAVVLGSFVVGEPDIHVRPLLKVQAGWELMRARQGQAALERFEAALVLAPGLSRARLGAGLAAASLGREGAARAVRHLGQVLADGGANPDPEAHRDTLMYLGLAHAWLGQLAEAKERLSEAAVRFPGDATVNYNLGCVEALGGDAEEAMYQLRMAFAADPGLVGHARDDEDLISLRDRPDFRALLAPAGDDR